MCQEVNGPPSRVWTSRLTINSCENRQSHVYGIDDFVAALEGVKLKDFKTGDEIGLTLFRYGGFYWKFIVNEDWKTLDSKSTLSQSFKDLR